MKITLSNCSCKVRVMIIVALVIVVVVGWLRSSMPTKEVEKAVYERLNSRMAKTIFKVYCVHDTVGKEFRSMLVCDYNSNKENLKYLDLQGDVMAGLISNIRISEIIYERDSPQKLYLSIFFDGNKTSGKLTRADSYWIYHVVDAISNEWPQ
jgi:hypothetical protein